MSRQRIWSRITALALLTIGATVAATASPIASDKAQAAVPDRAGFALYNAGVVSEQWPAGTTVLPTVPGRYAVTFPGLAIPDGIVHVVAVHDATTNPPGRWCQADAWGPSGANEVVKVSCYRPGGMLDPAPGFSVMFTRSSGPIAGGLYGYVHASAAAAILAQYNSVGVANAVAHAGAGIYSLTFTGLGTAGPNDGGLQVTAVNATAGARCKVAGWASTLNGQFVRIYCFNAVGTLTDNAFTASYQYKRSLYGPAFPPGRFGYLWNAPPLGPPTTNYNSSGAVNVLAVAPPLWMANFPAIAAPPGNLQVTAYGATQDFCGLHSPWINAAGNLVAQINCFNNVGNPVNTGFFASYSSRF